MKEPEDYVTVTGVCEDEMTLKGSRFIGIVLPCPDEDSIQSNLSLVSAKYPQATHYCYACIHSGSERTERSSDNGEPSGTAGKPILSVLKGSGLSDIMCVVVRYFGGTLLGTGGLVHAYTETSTLAMAKVQKRTKIACDVYMFSLDYSNYSLFESKCRDLMACKPECQYTDRVDVRMWVRVSKSEEFERRITDLTERHVRLTKLHPEYV